MVRGLQNKGISDPIIVDIQEELRRNVETISKISKMIEKGIDMTGGKDN